MQFLDKIKSSLTRSLRNAYKSYADERLVELFVKEKDEDAFYEIWRRHGNYIYGLAYRITRDHSSAEEIVQDVMMQLFQKLGTFSGQAKFSSWLYRVSANASYSFLRSKKKYSQELSLEGYAPYDEKGSLEGKIKSKGWSDRPDDVLFSKESLEVINRAIDELPDTYRLVFVLRDVEGFTNSEIADTLGITVTAVKTRLHRARLALRDKISDYFYEWGK